MKKKTKRILGYIMVSSPGLLLVALIGNALASFAAVNALERGADEGGVIVFQILNALFGLMGLLGVLGIIIFLPIGIWLLASGTKES